MDSSKQPKNFYNLSLCSGLLGIERGLEAVIPHFKSVAYVEIEAFPIFNLVSAMESGMVAPAPVWSNLKTFDPQPFRDRIHCITGGYPCQPFSVSGKQKGTTDPRHLYPHMEGIIRTIRPLCCFFENVPNHLNIGFDKVYQSLRSMGYTVEAGLYSAPEVNGQHIRKRLFILAVSDIYQVRQYVSDTNGSGGRNQYQPEQQENKAATQQSSHSLVHSKGRGTRKSENKNSERKGFGLTRSSRDGELADTDHSHLHLSSTERWEQNTDVKKNSIAAAELDESLSIRSQRYLQHEEAEKWKRAYRSITETIIPIAPPGQQQYEWEEPRTRLTRKVHDYIRRHTDAQGNMPSLSERQAQLYAYHDAARTDESSMGSTVNGYDFQTELLRAYGNSVVPQMARFAFLDLVQKHIKNAL